MTWRSLHCWNIFSREAVCGVRNQHTSLPHRAVTHDYAPGKKEFQKAEKGDNMALLDRTSWRHGDPFDELKLLKLERHCNWRFPEDNGSHTVGTLAFTFQLCQTPLLHIVSLVFLVVFRIICFLYFSQFLCLFVLCLYTFPASEIRFLKFAALRFLCQEFIVSPVCIWKNRKGWILANFDLLKFWSLTAGEVWTQTQLWIRSKNSWEGFTRQEDPCFLTPFPRFSPTEVLCPSHISTDLPRLAPASAQVGGPGWRQDGSLSLVGGSQSAVHTSL